MTIVMAPSVRVPFTGIKYIYMLVFHQSNCVSAIKGMPFYYRCIVMRVRSCICVFLVTVMHAKYTGLRVGVKTLYNTIYKVMLTLPWPSVASRMILFPKHISARLDELIYMHSKQHSTDAQQTTHHSTDAQQTTYHSTDAQQTTYHSTDAQ